MTNRDISDASVHKATGKIWQEWLADISQAETTPWPHKKIAEYLHYERGLTPWWSQTVAVAYEKMRGRRVTGEKSDASFQVGVRKTLSVSKEAAWELLISREGMALWMGDTGAEEPAPLEEGAEYLSRMEVSIVVRVFKPLEYIRLAWRFPGWPKISTLQIRVSETIKGKAIVSFHHENLPNQVVREQMRERWRDVLAAIAENPIIK